MPASLRVVSTDNTREGAEFQPPLTSTTNPVDKLGQVATKMLIDLIEGEPITSSVILGSKLVGRVSG